MTMSTGLYKNRGTISFVLGFIVLWLFLHHFMVPLLFKQRLSHIRHNKHNRSDAHISKSNNADSVDNLIYFKPMDILINANGWQVVNDPLYHNEIYLYSAYFDDRAKSEYYVRVMAASHVTASGLKCLLWYRNQKEPDAVKVSITQVGEQVLHHAIYTFQTLIFSCKVPDNRWPPESVSIIGHQSIIPTTLMKVEIPFRPPTIKDLIICVPPVNGVHSTKFFVEWMAILKELNVEKVVIYNNGIEAETLKIINHFVDKGTVEIKKMTFPTDIVASEGFRQLLSSVAANDCLYRNMMSYGKILISDLEEIILPTHHKTYLDMLISLDNSLPASRGRSYLFKGAYFWLDLPSFSDAEYLTIMGYLMRAPPSASADTQRSITDTKVCLGLNVRKCQKLLPQYENFNDWLTPVNMTIAKLHHYKKCDLDAKYGTPGLCNKTFGMVEVDDTGTNYVNKISAKVMETMVELKLIDKESLSEQNFFEAMEDVETMKREQMQRNKKQENHDAENDDKKKESQDNNDTENQGDDPDQNDDNTDGNE